MKPLVAALLLYAALPACALAGDAREEIEETLEKFVSAFNAGDGATVAGLYTEDAALLPPGAERVDGRDAIRAFWQEAMDSGMRVEVLEPVEVYASGDLAGEVGVFTLSVPGESGVIEVSGKYIVIWRRVGGVWLLHRDIWNGDAS